MKATARQVSSSKVLLTEQLPMYDGTHALVALRFRELETETTRVAEYYWEILRPGRPPRRIAEGGPELGAFTVAELVRRARA